MSMILTEIEAVEWTWGEGPEKSLSSTNDTVCWLVVDWVPEEANSVDGSANYWDVKCRKGNQFRKWEDERDWLQIDEKALP